MKRKRPGTHTHTQTFSEIFAHSHTCVRAYVQTSARGEKITKHLNHKPANIYVQTSAQTEIGGGKDRSTHTHAHTQRERERER